MKDIIKDVTKDVIKDVIIKEALPEDAEARIAYARQVGSETDNLSFGQEGFRTRYNPDTSLHLR